MLTLRQSGSYCLPTSLTQLHQLPASAYTITYPVRGHEICTAFSYILQDVNQIQTSPLLQSELYAALILCLVHIAVSVHKSDPPPMRRARRATYYSVSASHTSACCSTTTAMPAPAWPISMHTTAARALAPTAGWIGSYLSHRVHMMLTL